MVATKKKGILLKSVKDGIKKTITLNNECNYLISKINNVTGELIASMTLNSDVFDIQQVVEYFTNYQDMLDKNIFLAFMAFWSFMALSLIVADIFSNYHLMSNNDWFILINRKANCSLAYVLIVPCLLFSLFGSLFLIDLKKQL